MGAVILAFFVREALSRSYGGVAPFFTFYPVVFFAALLGGIWAGILATSLATTMALIWIYQPIGHFKIVSPSDPMASTLFLLIGVCMSVMVERYRSRQRRILALDGELALRETRANLEAALASMADAVIISDADGRFVREQSNFKLTRSGLYRHVAQVLSVSGIDGSIRTLDYCACVNNRQYAKPDSCQSKAGSAMPV